MTSMTSVAPSDDAAPEPAQPAAPPPNIPAPRNAADTEPLHSSIFLFLLAFRVANALLIRTFFQPDEHYQATEVAHHAIFGYGWRTWEWLQDEMRGGPIRGFLHPAIFAALFATIRALRLDSPFILVSLITCLGLGQL